jgi:4-amino-4-deoxy-L-arabinose transferase-like glycosyltransferase
MKQRRIGEWLFILGTVIFVFGSPADELTRIGAMALAFIGAVELIIRRNEDGNNMKQRRIGELLLILGAVLFVGGAVGYMTGQLPAEQIPGIGALALIFVGAGAGMKKMKP